MWTRRDDFSYGENHADIHTELEAYGEANGYAATHFADATCKCGGKEFRLRLDDTEGAAIRLCVACNNEHPIGDSADFLEDADLDECACPCGSENFEISAGISLYDGSEDVRWLYIGCRCTKCGLTACYGDWKNEFEGYQQLLSRV